VSNVRFIYFNHLLGIVVRAAGKAALQN